MHAHVVPWGGNEWVTLHEGGQWDEVIWLSPGAAVISAVQFSPVKNFINYLQCGGSSLAVTWQQLFHVKKNNLSNRSKIQE